MAAEKKVLVVCSWNGCVKYGPDGLYYEGTTHRKISVKKKTEFSRLLDGIYLITGLDKERSKLDIFGKYPVAVSPHTVRYLHLPVVDDTSLETMLEVPTTHPSTNSVELYLEIKPTSDDVINPAACSSPPENAGSSSKRQRTPETNGCADIAVTHPSVKLEKNRTNGSTRGGGDGKTMDKTSREDGVVQAGNLTGDYGNASKDLNLPGLEVSANALLKKGLGSSGSKPQLLSSLWVDELEMRVGLCFKDRDELKKAVDWCSIRGQQKCVVRETEKDKYTFECIRWKCKWSIHAARMDEHGFVEITKCSGPHTCCPIEPENFGVEYAAEEIEPLIRAQPTLTPEELGNWWFKKFGYYIQNEQITNAAKEKAIKKAYGDWDQSFRLLPKLMAAFQSSNGLLVDWRYDKCPNPEFASFSGVFCAFPQSVEGFRHCRPVMMVDSFNMNGKYPMHLMIACGVDTEDYNFILAYAVTSDVSQNSWRWFLNQIREKVTQSKDICLITAPHPDILTVINEPESMWKEPWAYHRLCLDRLSTQFYDMFQNARLQGLMKQAGLAIQQDKFDSHMETIKRKSSKAWQWLDQIPPHQWALAHDGGCRCGIMTMEMKNVFSGCESSQSLDLPVTAATLFLFDELRLRFYLGVQDARLRINQGLMYAKPVMDTLEKFSSASITYVVCPSDNNAFQVTMPSENEDWIVHLKKGTCTCGEYQRKKFPCLHALAVCDKLEINPLQYVDDFYSLEQLYKTYDAAFNHVPEVSAWPEADGVPTLLPPIIVPQPNPSHVPGETMDTNSSPDGEVHVVNLTENAHKDLNMPGLEVSANALLNERVGSRGSKPKRLSSLWVDELELRAGLCFKDRDELKKAVDWCSIRGQQKFRVRETEKDKYSFECIRWKCNWSIQAARIDEHGFVEITKCSGPHTCCPLETENFNVDYAAEEIEPLIRVQPTLTVDELGSWWREKFGYDLETEQMKAAKLEAIKKIYGDWDQSFRLLPKLMAAFQSSNGLLVDWRYDKCLNPEFAFFSGVFWAFPQSVKGFQHCRPVIMVDSNDMKVKYPMKLMIASGVDACNKYFPLAFAVTKEVSKDSWRWFLNGIREKVTQRNDICLISAPNPDILTVINEPLSLWKEPGAHHRLCLDRLSSQFYEVFQNSDLKSLMKKAGLALQHDEFDSHMETIKGENLEAWRWLDRIPPYQWAFAHDSGRRCGTMTREMDDLFSVCESFQSPDLPVTAATLLLFDERRFYFENTILWACSRLNQGEMYAKPVKDKLEEFRTASVTYCVCPLNNNAFQVTIPLQNDEWIVHLQKGTCTCGEYQKKKFPCLHALAVCEKLKINPLQFVDNFYSLEELYKTYAATFNPVPEVSDWPEAEGVPTLFPPFIIPQPNPTHVSGDGPS